MIYMYVVWYVGQSKDKSCMIEYVDVKESFTHQ